MQTTNVVLIIWALVSVNRLPVTPTTSDRVDFERQAPQATESAALKKEEEPAQIILPDVDRTTPIQYGVRHNGQVLSLETSYYEFANPGLRQAMSYLLEELNSSRSFHEIPVTP